MTCRGSRFADGAKRNPDGQVFMKNRETDEWLQQNHRSTRNFIRKWGHFVKHDNLLNPIVPPKYDIGFVVTNCNYETLYELEPWCSTIYGDYPKDMLPMYIRGEQENTMFNLKDRVKDYNQPKTNDIIVKFDARELTPEQFNYLANLSEIFANDEGIEKDTVGEFDLGIFKIQINSTRTYEEELIICKRS
tara:strand:- start:539 stop:1108 length:570 start_codon:yes stop_codon:yes gene_type:complete